MRKCLNLYKNVSVTALVINCGATTYSIIISTAMLPLSVNFLSMTGLTRRKLKLIQHTMCVKLFKIDDQLNAIRQN